MSVVNKMLQDLEQRQHAEQTNSADYQAPQKSTRSVVLLLVVLLISGAWYAYDNYVAQKAEVSAIPVVSAAKPEKVIDQVQPILLVEAQVKEPRKQPLPPEKASLDTVVTPQPQALSEPPVQASVVKPPQAQVAAPIKGPTKAVKHAQQSPAIMHIKPSGVGTTLRNRIKQALQAGDKKAAIQLMMRLADKEPDNILLRKKLASMQFASQQISEAQQNLSRWISQWPNRADLRLMLAKLYQKQQKPSQALSTLQGFNANAAEYVDYISMRANLAQQQGEHEYAYRDYLRLVGQYPKEARWWLGVAINAERTSQETTAKAAYQRALELAQLDKDVQRFIQQRLQQLEVQT